MEKKLHISGPHNWELRLPFHKSPYERHRVMNMQSLSGQRVVRNLRRIVLLAFPAVIFEEENLVCWKLALGTGAEETQKSFVRYKSNTGNKYFNLETEAVPTTQQQQQYHTMNRSFLPGKTHMKALCRCTKIFGKYLTPFKSLVKSIASRISRTAQREKHIHIAGYSPFSTLLHGCSAMIQENHIFI